MSSEASTLLGLLADYDRLRTVAALVLGSGPATAAEVADAARLDLRRAAKALTRLAGAGLVDQDGDSFALRPGRFREARESLGRPDDPAVPGSRLGADAHRILRIFVREGRLVQIPAVRGKRRVVLDWLARLFEPGRAYPEHEVNERLAGGTFEVDDPLRDKGSEPSADGERVALH